MKRLKPHLGQDGFINKGSSVLMFLVFVFNFIGIISNKDMSINTLTYTAPYLIGSVVVFVLSNKKYTLPGLLFFIGVYCIISVGTMSDLTGAAFLFLSFYKVKNNIYGLFLIMTTIVSLTIRAVIMEVTIPQSFSMVLGFSILYYLFYFIIYRSIPKPINTKIPSLTKTENALLAGLTSGKSQKIIIAELDLKKSQGYDMIRKIKEKLGTNSMVEIGCKMGSGAYSKNILKK